MKKLGPYVLTAIIALVLGVLLTMQYYAASEAVAKIEEEEVASVKWRVHHFKLSDENVFNELVAQGVEFPEIVLAQAQLETGNYRSAACLHKNNLFGLRHSNGTYMHFSHWTDAIAAYKKYIQKWDSKPPNYYIYLDKLGYAEDTSYTAKLKELVKRNKKK